MAMTPDSFTENDTYDKLVVSFLVIRIIVSAVMSVMNFTQLYYEDQFIRNKYKRYTLTSRLIVILGLACYPIFRIIYCAVLFKTHDFGYGSTVTVVGVWTTFFLFQSWIFVSCFWLQLLYTFFISKSIRFENRKRIWRLSWILWGLVLLYTVLCIIISEIAIDVIPVFYTAGFLLLLVVFGGLIAVNIFILSRQLKKYRKNSIQDGRQQEQQSTNNNNKNNVENVNNNNIVDSGFNSGNSYNSNDNSNSSGNRDNTVGTGSGRGGQTNVHASESMKTSIKKIKYLGLSMVFTIVCVLIRDLIFYVFIRSPMNDNSRHASSFITFFFETLQGIILMYAIADEPLNYFLLKNVTKGRSGATSLSSVNTSNRTRNNNNNNNNNNNTNNNNTFNSTNTNNNSVGYSSNTYHSSSSIGSSHIAVRHYDETESQSVKEVELDNVSTSNQV